MHYFECTSATSSFLANLHNAGCPSRACRVHSRTLTSAGCVLGDTSLLLAQLPKWCCVMCLSNMALSTSCCSLNCQPGMAACISQQALAEVAGTGMTLGCCDCHNTEGVQVVHLTLVLRLWVLQLCATTKCVIQGSHCFWLIMTR